jgi:hypothetical protein
LDKFIIQIKEPVMKGIIPPVVLIILFTLTGCRPDNLTIEPNPSATQGFDPPVTLVPPAGQVDLGTITQQPAATSAPQEMPRPGVPNPGIYLASLVSQDLAGRLGIDIDAISLVEQNAVEWPGSGLGCLQPGEVEEMVITRGYIIVLEAGSTQYTYHTDQVERFILCDSGGPVP